MLNETPSATERKHAIDDAMARIEKTFGRGSIMRMDQDITPDIAVIPSGCLGLDLALGIGGLPRGRVVEVYGPESSGKTTLTLHVIAEAQKLGGVCAFIDAEHALDANYARKLGVDVSRLLVSQPDCGEQALEIVEILVRSGGIDLIVVDSVAALVPRSEIEGEMGDNHVGLHARLMSQAMRKLTATASRTGTMVLFVNQIRMKIGVTFGSPETTTGGEALKFYSSVRLDIRRIGTVKAAEEVVANKVRIKVVKNKLAPPFRETEVELWFGRGICPWTELLDHGIRVDLISRAGAWFSMGDVRLGQGRDAARQWLQDHPDAAANLRARILDCSVVGKKADMAVA